MARHTLLRVWDGHAGDFADMDIRLEKARRSGEDFWLSRQTAYDLAQGRKDRV